MKISVTFSYSLKAINPSERAMAMKQYFFTLNHTSINKILDESKNICDELKSRFSKLVEENFGEKPYHIIETFRTVSP